MQKLLSILLGTAALGMFTTQVAFAQNVTSAAPLSDSVRIMDERLRLANGDMDTQTTMSVRYIVDNQNEQLRVKEFVSMLEDRHPEVINAIRAAAKPGIAGGAMGAVSGANKDLLAAAEAVKKSDDTEENANAQQPVQNQPNAAANQVVPVVPPAAPLPVTVRMPASEWDNSVSSDPLH